MCDCMRVICIFVCMYVIYYMWLYTWVCICMYMYVWLHIYIYGFVYVYIYVWINVFCMFVCMCAYFCMFVCLCACVHKGAAVSPSRLVGTLHWIIDDNCLQRRPRRVLYKLSLNLPNVADEDESRLTDRMFREHNIY